MMCAVDSVSVWRVLLGQSLFLDCRNDRYILQLWHGNLGRMTLSRKGKKTKVTKSTKRYNCPN